MKLKFFDFEIFESWWCLVVSDQEDNYLSTPYNFKFTNEEEQNIKNKMRVYTSDDGRSILTKIKHDITSGVVSGYNIKRYDLIILRCVLMGFTSHQLRIVSDLLIKPECINDSDEHIRISNYIRTKFKECEAFQDLMDDSDKGLKDKEASYGMDIRESEVPFSKKDLTQEDKERIIFYCKHDVFACHAHYICCAKPYINTKLSLGKTYDIPEKICYEATNAVLAGKVLGAERVSGTTIIDPTITIYQSGIKNYIERWVPKDILQHLLTSQKPKQMTLFNNKVHTGDGGIHSVFITPKIGNEQSKIYVEATEEYGLYNIDLSGCHPSVMLFCGAMPRSIKKPERFKESVFRRRKLKITPKEQWTPEDVEFVPAGKLVHNTTYGASGNKYLPLYDDYMRSKVCRVSQLIIIAVAMAISQQLDVKIIQTNTDGILLYTKRTNKSKIEALVKEFEDLSEFVFELEEDSKIWQLNVNNYIAESITGDLKLKGEAFITEIWQRGTNKVRPLNNHIIAKAQIAFYTKKINPVKMLLEHTKVHDFCLTCTKGGPYYEMAQDCRNDKLALGKVARVIATHTEKYGPVKKYKWQEIKPTVAQTKNGITLRDLVEQYKANNKLIKLENGKWYLHRIDTCANSPSHTWIVNDNLDNYHIEGPMSKRELVHKDGSRAVIDFTYYAQQLDKALDHEWYKLKDGKLEYTKEFSLEGGI